MLGRGVTGETLDDVLQPPESALEIALAQGGDGGVVAPDRSVAVQDRSILEAASGLRPEPVGLVDQAQFAVGLRGGGCARDVCRVELDQRRHLVVQRLGAQGPHRAPHLRRVGCIAGTRRQEHRRQHHGPPGARSVHSPPPPPEIVNLLQTIATGHHTASTR